ncbi:MAG: tetratricopeptide repeat protein [Cellvibrionaceae bacterium]|nr:tetratricopeptide repeat protein [Cellvibrionaceae bacterium]
MLSPVKPARALAAALLCQLTLMALQAQAQPQQTASPWRGSESCKDCHQQAYKDWQGSHHDWAMRPADRASVLGNFDNASFEHFGQRSRFYKQGQDFYIETDNAKGQLQNYKVAYTFGFYPLQQYLLETEPGRLQALTVAWDSRPKTEGGQRWFHLYPDEKIPAGDPLHWTGAYFNWNSRCAECHSTNLQRGYSAKQNRYNTSWSEINVACEACHGPGAKHIRWAETGANKNADKAILSLQASGQWQLNPGSHTAKRDLGPRKAAEPSDQLAVCGSCHSCRRMLGPQSPHRTGDSFLAAHSLQTLQSPLYHRDGQIQDEVYVLGSFMQSKMYGEGVVCSNCHQPHSLKLRGGQDGVCAQCHSPAQYAQPSHHHHRVGSPGAACVNCHMPETTYMVVDPRRDHSIRIPRPDLSEQLGSPNACVQCHQDKSNQWAAGHFSQWLQQADKTAPPMPALALSQPRQQLAALNKATPLVAATLLERLADTADDSSLLVAQTRLHHDEPLLRLAAVEFMQVLPPARRLQELQGLLQEPVKAVRLAIARQLLEADASQLAPARQAALKKINDEYWQALLFHRDTAAGQLNIGLYHLAKGQGLQAERAYRQALRLEPGHVGAQLNLADLLRAQGREAQALQQLRQAAAAQPRAPAVQHALGLALVRGKQYAAALKALAEAATLAPDNSRYQYVYAVALHSRGDGDRAIQVLERALQRQPDQPQLRQFLAQLYQRNGQGHKARKLMQVR